MKKSGFMSLFKKSDWGAFYGRKRKEKESGGFVYTCTLTPIELKSKKIKILFTSAIEMPVYLFAATRETAGNGRGLAGAVIAAVISPLHAYMLATVRENLHDGVLSIAGYVFCVFLNIVIYNIMRKIKYTETFKQ